MVAAGDEVHLVSGKHKYSYLLLKWLKNIQILILGKNKSV